MSHYFKDHYYTADALKSAYRDLCKANHPDRANQRMQEINGEYEILKSQLARDGVAGWNVPKEVKRDKPREPIKQDVPQSVRYTSEKTADRWTWEEIHAENQRVAEESLQKELNRMSDWIYDR